MKRLYITLLALGPSAPAWAMISSALDAATEVVQSATDTAFEVVDTTLDITEDTVNVVIGKNCCESTKEEESVKSIDK